MPLPAFLFLLFLAIFSDTIASAIGGFTLWSHSRYNGYSRMSRLLAFLMLGIFLDGVGTLTANGFGFAVKPSYTRGYAWSFWLGRGFRSVVLWRFVLYMLGGRWGRRSNGKAGGEKSAVASV